MEIATVRRGLNHTLTELERALEAHAVAQAADLYALAWRQASEARPSETREQRARLAEYSCGRRPVVSARLGAGASRLRTSVDGDTVAVRMQPDAENGEIVAAMIDGVAHAGE